MAEQNRKAQHTEADTDARGGDSSGQGGEGPIPLPSVSATVSAVLATSLYGGVTLLFAGGFVAVDSVPGAGLATVGLYLLVVSILTAQIAGQAGYV